MKSSTGWEVWQRADQVDWPPDLYHAVVSFQFPLSVVSCHLMDIRGSRGGMPGPGGRHHHRTSGASSATGAGLADVGWQIQRGREGKGSSAAPEQCDLRLSGGQMSRHEWEVALRFPIPHVLLNGSECSLNLLIDTYSHMHIQLHDISRSLKALSEDQIYPHIVFSLKAGRSIKDRDMSIRATRHKHRLG